MIRFKMRSRSSIQVSALLRSCFEVRTAVRSRTSMAEGTRAYRRIGTRDPAAQRLARTLAQTEQVLTDGRRDRLLFHNLWGGRWARVFGGGGWLRGWGAGSSEERGQIIAGYLHEAGPEAREEYLAGVRRGLADLEHENRILQLQLRLHQKRLREGGQEQFAAEKRAKRAAKYARSRALREGVASQHWGD